MSYYDLFIESFKPTKNQINQLDQYASLIKEYNQVMNLTGIDEYQDVYLKHFYDSMLIKPLLDQLDYNNIADLGSGAGLPGIVLAIMYPDKQFYLIEPITKRANFLKIVVETLALENVVVINKRMEEVEEKFDIIVSRAVANLNILLELSIPFLNKDGYLIALKGNNGKNEADLATGAMGKLDCQLVKIDEQQLPDNQGERSNLLIKKDKETNSKYPRNYGQIKKSPLK